MLDIDRGKHIEVIKHELLFLYQLLERDIDWEARLSVGERLIEVYSHLRHEEWLLQHEKKQLMKE